MVIITDVYKGKRYRVDAIQKYGATEYIEKPIEDADLVSILQGLVPVDGAGQTVVAPPAAGLEEKTVQFDRNALLGKMGLDAQTAHKAAEKKADKPKSKDEMERKLEQSLAGLDLGMGKPRPKPKPAPETKPPEKAPPAPASAESSPSTMIIQKDEAPGATFTSEDLFTDVIASVERELQSGS